MPDTAPTPPPPYAEGTGLPWDVTVVDAVAAIGDARRRHGDTFAVRSGADRYLFTFSPTGVESFYALPEQHASKGVADFLMLRRKLPEEIFDGRRTLPTSLFRRDDVTSYLGNLARALEHTIAELGDDGTVDVFDLTRRLGSPDGPCLVGGTRLGAGRRIRGLVLAFDTLDGSDAFVHPDAMAAVAASGKRAERAALDDVVARDRNRILRSRLGCLDDDVLFEPDRRRRGEESG